MRLTILNFYKDLVLPLYYYNESIFRRLIYSFSKTKNDISLDAIQINKTTRVKNRSEINNTFYIFNFLLV